MRTRTREIEKEEEEVEKKKEEGKEQGWGCEFAEIFLQNIDFSHIIFWREIRSNGRQWRNGERDTTTEREIEGE